MITNMSFAIDLPSPELHLSNDHALPISTNDEHTEWRIALAFVGRIVVYIAILALLAMIVALIVKYLGNWDGEDTLLGTGTSTETNRLLGKEVVPFTYGTCEEDVESGNCSNSSSSEDLYDGKICVICYEEQRNCFFIPCGHCATCYICARRIKEEESKTCPVCRRYIHKVRKLFVS